MELKLSVAREQTNRSASSKLEHMLSIQKSPLDKIGLDFKNSISMPKTHSINFVPSSGPLVSEVVKTSTSEAAKTVEVTPPRKIRVDLKESKPKNPTIHKDKKHDRPLWVCHFSRKTGHIHSNCFKLHAAKRVNKSKVLVPHDQKYLCLNHS